MGWRQWIRERLPADVLQEYIQDQVVQQYASRSDRTATGPAEPAEGMVSLLLDEHTLERYASDDSWRVLAGPVYYDEGAGAGAINATTGAGTDAASVIVPAGTYDVDYAEYMTIAANSNRAMTLQLFGGSSELDSSVFQVWSTTVAGNASREASSFVRLTLADVTTLKVQAVASATGGVMTHGRSRIRARRVSSVA